jgi:hypothetical protein
METGEWLRGLDSNQDNQLQRLACYQLHYPGLAQESVAEILGFWSPGRNSPVLLFAALAPIC